MQQPQNKAILVFCNIAECHFMPDGQTTKHPTIQFYFFLLCGSSIRINLVTMRWSLWYQRTCPPTIMDRYRHILSCAVIYVSIFLYICRTTGQLLCSNRHGLYLNIKKNNINNLKHREYPKKVGYFWLPCSPKSPHVHGWSRGAIYFFNF